ncbi:hypothetical protein [Aestuariibacter salexigens]|uniref:hypothetical protein n=1 Tax=Aestuariibacter salexigens TaxID=226010 RepID=UPI00047B59B0|nr:hypothetical protein [Aestuariibacter salexigens]
MNRVTLCLVSLLAASLSACSSTKPCEDILEVKRQEMECARLAKVMNDSSRPQQALTARKRYEEACQDLRYYRDDYDTICKGDNKPIGQKNDN